MDNLRRLLGVRRMDIVLNAWIKELSAVKKGLNERINEGMLPLFSHVERMEKGRIAKRDYVEECAGSCSVGSLQKRWINAVKECLRKRGFDVRQARRIGVNGGGL